MLCALRNIIGWLSSNVPYAFLFPTVIYVRALNNTEHCQSDIKNRVPQWIVMGPFKLWMITDVESAFSSLASKPAITAIETEYVCKDSVFDVVPPLYSQCVTARTFMYQNEA